MLPEIYCCWAQYRAANGDLPVALSHARRAVDLADDLGLELEQGKCQRVLGNVLFAAGQPEQATKAFEESLSILVYCDDYEAACTKLAWGQMLMAKGDGKLGEMLREEAHAVFQQLAALCTLSLAADIQCEQ